MSIASFTANSQESNTEKLYNWHDSQIKTTEIFNGKLHSNQDRTVDIKNHRYFGSNEFAKGNIIFNNQKYSNILLKYDLTKDMVIFLPEQDNNLITIEIINKYVNSFEIQNSKFIHLESNNKNISEGFFEEKIKTNVLTFYIKHKKESKDILNEKGKLIEYFTYEEYYIEKDNTFYKITSKKDLTNIFPDLKQKIEDYYEMNKNHEKENYTKFLSSLIQNINNLLQTK